MRKLENVTVTHVSYVDKAANKKKFFLTKSEKEPTFETKVRLVTKTDDPQKLVYGVVYEPEIEDSHGDYMEADTIEKAAHGFMENFQQIDKQHDFTTNAGKVVESYVAPVDMTFDDDEKITKGSWVLVTKATDEMWESIQKGEFTGYSLAGSAEVEEVQKRTKDNFNRRKVHRDIDAAIDAFRSATWQVMDNYEDTDAEKIAGIQSEIQELSELVSNATPINKTATKQGLIEMVKSFFIAKKEEEEEMTPEELKKALEEALTPISKRLDDLEKDEEKAEENETKITEDVKKDEAVKEGEAIAKAVAEAIKPLNEKIEKLEKTRISNNNEPSYNEEIQKSKVPDYVNAVFPVEE